MEEGVIINPFQFLYFWVKHKNFHEVKRQNWMVNFVGSLFIELQEKLKKVKKKLCLGGIKKLMATFSNRYQH